MIDIGSMYAKIEADTSGLKDAEKDIVAFAKRAATAIAGIVTVQKVMDVIKEVTFASARYDTMGVVMENVGKKAGYTTGELKKYEAQIRKAGISMTKTREVITRMSQAEIDLSKSTDLARVAQNAAVIGNIDSSDAFARMIRGIQSGEKEILKTIGINADFQASYSEMAASMGKTAGELTNYEKTQARVNSVLLEGAKILGTYEAAMDTPMKKFLSLTRHVDDAKVRLGQLFTPAFGTSVDAATAGLKGFNKNLDDSNIKEWGAQLDWVVGVLMDVEKAVASTAKSAADHFASGAIGSMMAWGFEHGFGAIKQIHGDVKTLLGDESAQNEYIDSWRRAGSSVAQATEASTKQQAQSLKTLEKKYKEHVQNITTLSREIQSNLEQGAQTIRDIQREGMSKAGAQRDLKREADEYAKASEKALVAWKAIGDAKTDQQRMAKDAAFEDIIRYSDTAQSKYLEMDRTSATTRASVIKNVQEMINLRDQALTTAKGVETSAANALIKESDFTLSKAYFEDIKEKTKEISTVSYPAMSKAFKEVWDGGAESASLVFTNIAEVAAETGKLIDENLWAVEKGKSANVIAEITKVGETYIGVGEDAIRVSKASTKEQVKGVGVVQSEVAAIEGVFTNVYDKATEASARATSKMISDLKRVKKSAEQIRLDNIFEGSGLSVVAGKKLGGYIQKLQKGGKVLAAQAGRFFPGYGGGDKIPIMGEAGEQMIRKESVRAGGRDTADAYNRSDWATVVGNLTSKFGMSGDLSPATASASGSSSSEGSSARKYYVPGEPEPIEVQADNRNASRLFNTLKTRYNRRS